MPELCRVCGGRGWHTAGGNDPAACGACPAGEAWYADTPGVAQPERHSEAYDPGPRRRIGGQHFDVDDVPPRADRDY